MCVLHANACVYGLLYQCVLSESSVFFFTCLPHVVMHMYLRVLCV